MMEGEGSWDLFSCVLLPHHHSDTKPEAQQCSQNWRLRDRVLSGRKKG